MSKESKKQKWLLERLVVFFIVYGIIGWLIESIISLIINHTFLYESFLHIPFSLVYAIGGMLISLIFQDDDHEILIIVLIGGIFLTAFQYLSVYLVELIFDIKMWNYTNIKFNIQGRVCALTTLIIMFASVLIIKYINPYITRKIKRFRYKQTFEFVLSLIILIIVVDAVISIIFFF